ncbi:MAG: hypothetical protein M3Q27_11025 [Actinomycetota bacterium]|nr:hypothetical protein [Actinomycetota bacterium]
MAGVQGHDRLVGHPQLPAVQRLAQVALHAQPLLRAAVQAPLVHEPLAGSRGLGLVHRRVRLPQQRLARVGGGVGAGDADAAGDVDGPGVQRERLGPDAGDPPDEVVETELPRGVLQQDRELVAAEARDGVLRPHGSDQPRHDRLQQLVPDVVPQRVVDVLEPVEVDEDDRDGSSILTPARERRLGTPGEQPAVGQAGEAVMGRVVAQAPRHPVDQERDDGVRAGDHHKDREALPTDLSRHHEQRGREHRGGPRHVQHGRTAAEASAVRRGPEEQAHQ